MGVQKKRHRALLCAVRRAVLRRLGLLSQLSTRLHRWVFFRSGPVAYEAYTTYRRNSVAHAAMEVGSCNQWPANTAAFRPALTETPRGSAERHTFPKSTSLTRI